jgi:hypothetical protein
MHIIWVVAFVILFSISNAQQTKNEFAQNWEYVGIAVEEPGYTIWGCSPIIDEYGKVHLFVARWPSELKVDPGWRSHSEIAHYIADNPEGPFIFSDVALTKSGKETWDKYGPHNPAIHKIGSMYYLFYIANNNPKPPVHPANQCIGLAVSESLNGPWEKVGNDGMILAPPTNAKYWNYKPSNGVNNPAFLQHPEGGYFLYFKSQGGKMGVAIAENAEGPYVQLPFPVTQNNQAVEDGYAFVMDGKICLLTTDNHGLIEKGGGILWKSEDGIHFTEKEQGFLPLSEYVPELDPGKATRIYGGMIKLERPQVLLLGGKPAYLYAPSGYNIYGGESTVSYVLKRK